MTTYARIQSLAMVVLCRSKLEDNGNGRDFILMMNVVIDLKFKEAL
jgi:hypothetical protein